MAENRNRGNTWVAGAGFGLLTVNSGLAIYRANGDPASILFVAASYLTLLLLFLCLRDFERAPPGSPARERARCAVWPLTTALTLGFAWKVAAVMPNAVAAAVVWGLAVATTVGGFFVSSSSPADRYMDGQADRLVGRRRCCGSAAIIRFSSLFQFARAAGPEATIDGSDKIQSSEVCYCAEYPLCTVQ